jgi:hypothetical protein
VKVSQERNPEFSVTLSYVQDGASKRVENGKLHAQHCGMRRSTRAYVLRE